MEGDHQKMREALKAIAAICDGDDAGGLPERIAIYNLAKAALSEPARNCDVGTAEDQDRRFSHMFCRAGIDGCVKCSLNVLPHRGNTCGIHWAQMPYEEGGTE